MDIQEQINLFFQIPEIKEIFSKQDIHWEIAEYSQGWYFDFTVPDYEKGYFLVAWEAWQAAKAQERAKLKLLLCDKHLEKCESPTGIFNSQYPEEEPCLICLAKEAKAQAVPEWFVLIKSSDRDREVCELIDERDHFTDQAEQLKDKLQNLYGVDFGEHSNCNFPFQNAIDFDDSDFVLVEKSKLMQIIGSVSIIEPITRGNPYMDSIKRELTAITDVVKTVIEAQEQKITELKIDWASDCFSCGHHEAIIYSTASEAASKGWFHDGDKVKCCKCGNEGEMDAHGEDSDICWNESQEPAND